MPPEGGNCRITPSGNAGRDSERCYGSGFVLRKVDRNDRKQRIDSRFP